MSAKSTKCPAQYHLYFQGFFRNREVEKTVIKKLAP